MEKLKKLFTLMALTVLASQFLVMKTFAYSVGAVVINEVAWAGTTDGSNDEWIELYNTTNQAVDLTGWKIEDDGVGSYVFTVGTIAPHGYFLIEDSELSVSNVNADAVIGLSLANAGDSLVLKDNSGVVIDTVNGTGGAWYAGNATSKATMERIDPNVTLDSADNWATAVSSNGSLGRTGSQILGTPRGANSNYGGGSTSVNLVSLENVVGGGDQFVVSADVDSVTDLYAYGFEIHYDPAIFSYVSATEGSFLKVDGKSTVFSSAILNSAEGTLIVGGARLINPPDGIDGSGKLFELTFEASGESGDVGEISFNGNNFLADSFSDIPAKYNNLSLSIENQAISTVSNLRLNLGQNRYSLNLAWDLSGANSYIVKKKMPDGNFSILGEVNNIEFTDNSGLIPGVKYYYQVIAVKDGKQSLPVEINGTENRGIKGDLDRSDRVDGRDIEKLARSFGSEFGDEEYNLLNDTNFDGIIDGKDLIELGANFGLTYSL